MLARTLTRTPAGRLRRRVPALVAAACATALLAGCGTTGSSGDSGGSDAGTVSQEDRPAAGPAKSEALTDSLTTDTARKAANANRATTTAYQPAVISTGDVSLRSDDVARARFDVMKVVDAHRGQVTDESTQTDKAGDIDTSRLVLRVPAGEFTDTMTELGKVGTLESSSSKSEDVTTQVIDTQTRVEAQQKSIERVELLLDRAQSMRDIIAIEAQLTRRQADLDSLKQQLAYLQDQTSMSTITVHLELTPSPKAAADDDTGFLAGLAAGWGAFTSATVGLATVLGALVPFVFVGLLVGVPVWLLVRRSARSRRQVT